ATRAARDADLPRTWVPSAHASSDAKPDVKPGATSDATAGATKAASDATKAASPANGASAPGAGTPASSAEAPRSVLDRAQSWLVRLLQDEAWKRLSERPMRVDESIDLGTFATGNVKIETVVEDTRWDASRMIHETIAQARGLATKWLRTTGSLELSAPAPAAQPASASGNTIGGKLEAHYEISRPYDYREGQLVPADLFAKLRSAVVTLPLDHHRAEGLEAGSKFSMSGRLQGDAAGKLSAPMTGRATLDARASVDVERQGGTEVVVTIRSSSDLDARATHEVTGRSLTATLGRDRVAMRTFTLDLSKPEAERAYDRLVRFDPEEPIALAKRNAPGVTMTSESVRAEDSAAVEGRADLSATTKVDGRIGVTRVETPDDRRTELTGRAGVVSNPSDATRLEGSLDARFERREAKLGTVEREGRLGAEAKLTTKLGEETPVTVGFTGNGSVDYRFSHPAAEDDLPLPLDGDAARRMPEGASFTLIGNGRLGAKASDARALGGGNTTASVDVSADGRIWLRADKKGGDTIEVDVMVRKNAELDRAARWSRPAADGAAGFGLDYGGTTRTSSDRSGRFQLDLSKEAHRAAYRALLRGDMGPAAAATNVPVPTADTRLDNRDRVRAEVTKLASWADASLELERRSIDAKDPFVTMDADRSAFNDAQKAGGREVRWIDVSGAIAPKVRVEGTTPIGGAVSLRHGFSAEGLVEYRAVRPDLPGVALSPALTAKAAEALPRGSEMALSGTGTLRGSTGLGFGAEYATTGVRASAAAGVDAKVAVSKTYDVRVKRLSDAKVSVTVEERARDERGLDLFARVGATVSTAELVTLPGALGKLDALAKVRTAVDRELSSLLSLDFTHSSTRAKVDTQRAELTIDLSTPAGKKAYEAILGLDADPALAAARRGDAGVKIDSAGIEHTKERGQETKLDAFGSKLYLSKALRSDSTRIDVTSNGETRRDASTYDESYRGLFGRKQNVKWEAVRVRTAEDPVGQGYYRFTFDDADPITSKAEVRSMMRMATGLGAEHAHAPKVEKDRRGLLPLLGSWGQHGKTKAGGEIFLTDKGLQALRALDDEAARLAYAEGLRSTHGGNLPAWADPVKGPKARAILDEFFQYERDRAGAHDGDRRSGLNSEYWWHTGTNLWEDEGDYKSSKAFVEMVRRIRESTDPAMWNKAYADLGEQLRFDFFDSLGAIGRVAGKSETLVHKLEMKGRVIDIQMKDEGLLARP
ncbi:hypothetical protein L6R52_40085, partial [Myxococcota bacterium]|nr:hypothetical protein [Myxococcota bacterium]